MNEAVEHAVNEVDDEQRGRDLVGVVAREVCKACAVPWNDPVSVEGTPRSVSSC
jgi:hypothetical protein